MGVSLLGIHVLCGNEIAFKLAVVATRVATTTTQIDRSVYQGTL